MPENKSLNGLRVAILATDGVEDAELREPREALDKAGAKTTLIAAKQGSIQSFNHFDKADEFKVDELLGDADPKEFDAVLLPGGALNADTLRVQSRAQEFVREVDRQGKPIAVICHGPWLLIEAGVIKGGRATSDRSIKTDMKNAGAKWVDEQVVVDHGLITSRKPDDLKAFSQKLIEEFAEGRHHQRMVA